MSAPAPTPSLISSVAELEVFVPSMSSSCTLYLDLEGHNLGRNGTIAIVTVLLHPQGQVRLIDVSTLKGAAFTTQARNGKSLQSVLEDWKIPKCLWDARNDADALWAHYRVRLSGVIDVQLLENASRWGDKTYLRGLDKCIQYDLNLGFVERDRWSQTKKDIKDLMSNDIFGTRPMDPKTVRYCANDVTYLPDLRFAYMQRIESGWLTMAMDESELRVIKALSPFYEPQSPTKKLGPWGAGTVGSIIPEDELLKKMEDLEMNARGAGKAWMG